MKMQLIVGAVALFVASGAFTANLNASSSSTNAYAARFNANVPKALSIPYYYCDAEGHVVHTATQADAVDPGPYVYQLSNNSLPPDGSPARGNGNGHCKLSG